MIEGECNMSVKLSYKDMNKCRTCHFYTTETVKISVDGIADGYCRKLDVAIAKLTDKTGCTEWRQKIKFK
jgi:hypothetical protein